MAISAVLDISGWSASPYLTKNATYEVPYIVYTTSLSEDAAAIEASGALPAYGTPYPGNPILACIDCKLKREAQQPLIWRAAVTYKVDSISDRDLDRLTYPDPCDRPASIEWDTVGYSVIRTQTVEDYRLPGAISPTNPIIPVGTIISNSAKERFDPPPEVTDFRWTTTIQKNVRTIPSWILSAPGRVNSAAFTVDGVSVSRMSSRLVGIRIGRRERDNGYSYRDLRMVLEHRSGRSSRYEDDVVPEPYILEIQDEGYTYQGESESQKGRIRVPPYRGGAINTTKTDPPYPVPYPLNGSGLPIETPTFENAVLRPFCVYESFDFSQLPLT